MVRKIGKGKVSSLKSMLLHVKRFSRKFTVVQDGIRREFTESLDALKNSEDRVLPKVFLTKERRRNNKCAQ